MSEWNNSYAYNNQYQGANTWNGDLNNQYMNQAYYQNRQFDQQYVSFDEFISQMQSNNAAAPAAGNFNNMQYQNFAAGQYNYQNMPSTSSNAQSNYGPSSSVPNEPNGYQAQSQYQLQEPNSFTNEMVFKSNLTPTATEFVPKSSVQASMSSDNLSSEASSLHEGVKESKSTHGSSSSTNWRERPQNSQQNGSRHNERYQQNESSKQEMNYKNDANNSRIYDRNHEPRNRNQESNRYENSNRNHDSRNESNRNERNVETSNRNDSRNYETNRNQERNYEPNRYDRGQSKNNSKTKNKDSERTFYNSSINKGSQDVRIGREGPARNRNWVGSQRVRRDNTAEDEQYANSYLQQREEKAERVRNENVPSPSRSRNKPAADIKGTSHSFHITYCYIL